MLAVAVTAGALAFGRGVAVAEEAPEPETILVGASPADVIGSVAKYVKGLYEDYQRCEANKAIGQPCKATDSDNIRESLRLLKGLSEQVAANQKTLVSRLDDLEIAINQVELATYQETFSRIGKSTPRAILAFTAMVNCQAAKDAGQATCELYDESGASLTRPVDDGIRQNRGAFLAYTSADSLPQSLPNTVARYAGTDGALDRNSFMYALWRFAKLKVDIDAGATQAVFRRSPYAPFVTPKMSKEVNAYLDYYGQLLAAQGEVLFLRGIVLRDLATAAGDTNAATDYQDAADRIRQQIQADIESTDANSVRGVDETYRLTPIVTGEMLMATEQGVGAMAFLTERRARGDRAMLASDVAALGQGLSLYGRYSTLKENQPQAFPQSDNWYEVLARTTRLTCDHDAIYLTSGRNENVNWLPSVVVPKDYDDTFRSTRVKLLDNPPTWSTFDASRAPEERIGCGDGRGRDYRVEVWTWNNSVSPRQPRFEASELRFPMTYDWATYEFKQGIVKQTKRFGEGVAFEETTKPVNRIFVDTAHNQLVRWPEGYEPTGMPGSY